MSFNHPENNAFSPQAWSEEAAASPSRAAGAGRVVRVSRQCWAVTHGATGHLRATLGRKWVTACVCAHAYAHVCLCTHMCMCMRVCALVRAYACVGALCTCAYVHVCACMRVCACLCAYSCVCVRVSVCVRPHGPVECDALSREGDGLSQPLTGTRAQCRWRCRDPGGARSRPAALPRVCDRTLCETLMSGLSPDSCPQGGVVAHFLCSWPFGTGLHGCSRGVECAGRQWRGRVQTRAP